ncbi:nucleotide-diphospho-sugar transferase [uncultured Mucilaginibacter sp.]|uniref:nucleotide-diphospho-sugar transferase n=1 Tax=uncultured Mucilaginibacter sp. TaxID=797541 RepID=UPI0025CE506C|nr:nucleotide-diphospho-sugar transferase [uncultured Mucilaginibacter sp.]
MQNYQTRSAVLFLIFNRPDVTKKVFEQIRHAKPARLYVAADGPRSDKENEALLCEQTRAIIKAIDWDCELKTLYRDENLGCKVAVSSAIGWFFDQEDEGIILEDDCLPVTSFFYFCDTLLDYYRNDNRVRHIAGSNFQQGNTWGEASYYFSKLTHVWGWASWKRVWADYDVDLSDYNDNEVKQQLHDIFGDTYVVNSWMQIFEVLKAKKINTWDYQLAFTNFMKKGLSVMPNVNLVSNIGFGSGATHTSDIENENAGIPLSNINDIIHPKNMLPEKEADMFTLNKDFNVEARKKKDKTLKARFKRLFIR